MSVTATEAPVQIIVDGGPIVATVNETMIMLKISRATLYQLLNSGQLQSFREGKARKILCRSIETYVERRLNEEACRRGLK
jgi:hypothetical protein